MYGEVLIDEKFFKLCSNETHGKKTAAVVEPEVEPIVDAVPQTVESIIESELKKFGYEDSEEEIDDSEDFYSDSATIVSKISETTMADIDEGFFDKPTTSPEGLKSEEESSVSFQFGFNSARERSACA